MVFFSSWNTNYNINVYNTYFRYCTLCQNLFCHKCTTIIVQMATLIKTHSLGRCCPEIMTGVALPLGNVSFLVTYMSRGRMIPVTTCKSLHMWFHGWLPFTRVWLFCNLTLGNYRRPLVSHLGWEDQLQGQHIIMESSILMLYCPLPLVKTEMEKVTLQNTMQVREWKLF